MRYAKRLFGTLFSLAIVAAAFSPAFAASRSFQTKILTFSPKLSKEARAAAASNSGCSILRELPLIGGVECRPSRYGLSFSINAMRESGVVTIEANTYRKWIETAAPIPSVSKVLAGAREDFSAPAVGDGAAVLAGGESGADAKTPDEKYMWGLKRVRAEKIWSRATGSGVKVAVIDTGIDYTHPDLAANYVGGFNAVDAKSTDPKDDNGHGTHVAGTIASAGSAGAPGVAPEASLFAVKVLDADGGGTYASIIAGIQWAVENKMDVINMSLGGPSSPALEKAVKAAHKAGITIVAAAGNDPSAEVSAPAMYAESIAISASAFDDSLAFFSTTGPEVDFIAPGHEIDSTWPGGGYARLSGTSMATPHAAGLAALAISLGANGPDAVRAKMTQAAVKLEGLSGEQQGAGMIEADRWGLSLIASADTGLIPG